MDWQMIDTDIVECVSNLKIQSVRNNSIEI